MNHQTLFDKPILGVLTSGLISIVFCSCISPVKQSSSGQDDKVEKKAEKVVVQPALEPVEHLTLPEAKRFVIERIAKYVVSDYIGSMGGYPVKQSVAVKFVGQEEVAHYPIDASWALAEVGDVAVFTPSLDRGKVYWDTSIEFASPHQKIFRH